jgi:hypothetical protein
LITEQKYSGEPQSKERSLTPFVAMGKKKVGALEKVDADLYALPSLSHISELRSLK